VGTFHDDKGELHGITVVVQMRGARVYVGRCDQQTAEGILMLDVDHHDDGQDGRSTTQYLERAHKFGVFAKAPKLFVPNDEIEAVYRLGALRPE
jgi:hypothetical protein